MVRENTSYYYNIKSLSQDKEVTQGVVINFYI